MTLREFILSTVTSSNIDVTAVTNEDIRDAACRLKNYIHLTPLITSRSLSEAMTVSRVCGRMVCSAR